MARLLIALLVLCALPAAAQDSYPTRSITLIVPFAAGGSTDVIARVVGEAMRGPLGQTIVIDNRGGAGGSIGTAAIAKAAPDGHTIGMGTASTLAINPAAYKSLPYDATKFAPITVLALVPNVITARKGLPADTVEGEILVCPDCAAELEVTAVDPPTLALAPEVGEDWGE